MNLSEIEGYEGQVFGLVKFTSRVESFQKGEIYMNNLREYINMERETGIKGMGDKLEAARVHAKVNYQVYMSDSDKLVYSGMADQMSYRLDEDEVRPVYCMFALHAGNLKIIDEDKYYYHTRINLSDKEIEYIIKDFGEKLVFVDASHLLNKLVGKFEELQYPYKAQMVKYDDYGINYSERLKAYEKEDHDIFFWKDKRFGYQHEYRIVLYNQSIEEGLTIQIGDITDYSKVINTIDFFKEFGLSIKKV